MKTHTLRLFGQIAITGFIAIFSAHSGVAQAPRNAYVFNTGDAPLPSSVMADVLARAGRNAIVTVINPFDDTATTINGPEVRFTGYSEQPSGGLVGPPFSGRAAHYFFAGDLTLNANDSIFAYGPNLLSLEVGNNAFIRTGAVIDVSASQALAGAGGGAPGLADRNLASFSSMGGSGGVGGGGNEIPIPRPSDGGAGQEGRDGADFAINNPQQGFPNYDSRLALSSLAGGDGGVGSNDYLSAPGVGGAGMAFNGDLPMGGAAGFGGDRGVDSVGFLPPGAGQSGRSGADGEDGPDGLDGAAGTSATGGGVVPGLFFYPLRAGSGGALLRVQVMGLAAEPEAAEAEAAARAPTLQGFSFRAETAERVEMAASAADRERPEPPDPAVEELSSSFVENLPFNLERASAPPARAEPLAPTV